MKKIIDQYGAISIVFLVAFFLRVYGFNNWSLSNDELSALCRLQFDSFSNMIHYGVMLDDMHPMGVQSFLWLWKLFFNPSLNLVRLPFVCLGCASVVLVYLIAKQWMNNFSSSLSTAFFATLQFPILYSQLARPYSPGLFFSLLFVYGWSKFIRYNDKSLIHDYNLRINSSSLIFLLIGGVGAMYSHYFSFLFVGIVGLIGLFFIRGKALTHYLFSGILMFLCYIPNINVFSYQMNIGGLGGPDGWLSAPPKTALIDYLFYGFNESWTVCLLLLIILVSSFYKSKGNIFWSKWKLLCLLFFTLPALIAYFYSVFVNPVFQYSILLFGWPFGLMFFCSFLPELNSRSLDNRIVLFCLSILVFSTVFEKRFYSTQHFGVFSNLVDDAIKIKNKVGDKNLIVTMNVIKPFYVDFYSKNNLKIQQYQCANDDQLIQLDSLLQNSSASTFFHGWSNIYHAPEIASLVKSYFPYLVQRNYYWNSGSFIYSKDSLPQSDTSIVFVEKNDFEVPRWMNDSLLIQLDPVKSNQKNHVSFMDSSKSFGSTLIASVASMQLKKDYSITIVFKAWSQSKIEKDDVVLVMEITNKAGDKKLWRSVSFAPQLRKSNEWQTIYFGHIFTEDYDVNDVVKCYVFNPKSKCIAIDDVLIQVAKDIP